jgi:hypothetical protein
MSQRFHILVVVLVLLAVVIVFFAPTVDLEPTAMRAVKAASIIFLAIAAVGQTVTNLVLFSRGPFESAVSDSNLWSHLLQGSLLDMNCTRLC